MSATGSLGEWTPVGPQASFNRERTATTVVKDWMRGICHHSGRRGHRKMSYLSGLCCFACGRQGHRVKTCSSRSDFQFDGKKVGGFCCQCGADECRRRPERERGSASPSHQGDGVEDR